MNTPELKETIKKELPQLLREDKSFRDFILQVTKDAYADKEKTEDRIERILEELRRDREEQSRKWEEQNRKWEEQNRKWEEQNRKWEENNQRLKEIHSIILAQAKKYDRSIGALGARWGIKSERSFRNALAGILKENFDVKVVTYVDFDDTGEVFGRPEQIELDIIIKNGLLIICELKSSMSINDMYIFERKARFYEKRHQRKAHALLVISPMVDARAMEVAKKLGIKVYSDSSEVTSLEEL